MLKSRDAAILNRRFDARDLAVQRTAAPIAQSHFSLVLIRRSRAAAIRRRTALFLGHQLRVVVTFIAQLAKGCRCADVLNDHFNMHRTRVLEDKRHWEPVALFERL
jgi:hypothetical protein